MSIAHKKLFHKKFIIYYAKFLCIKESSDYVILMSDYVILMSDYVILMKKLSIVVSGSRYRESYKSMVTPTFHIMCQEF